MPKDNNAFDFETISDVILHLKYSAREGGEPECVSACKIDPLMGVIGVQN
jgi:hypothetical protein